jgi:hypothetical protein
VRQPQQKSLVPALVDKVRDHTKNLTVLSQAAEFCAVSQLSSLLCTVDHNTTFAATPLMLRRLRLLGDLVGYEGDICT